MFNKHYARLCTTIYYIINTVGKVHNTLWNYVFQTFNSTMGIWDQAIVFELKENNNNEVYTSIYYSETGFIIYYYIRR